MLIDIPNLTVAELFGFMKSRVSNAEAAIELIGTKVDKQMEAKLFGAIDSAQQAARLKEYDRLRNLVSVLFETSEYYKRMRGVLEKKTNEGSAAHKDASGWKFFQFLAHSFQIDKLGIPLPAIEDQKNEAELIHINANLLNSEIAKLLACATLGYPQEEITTIYENIKAICEGLNYELELWTGAWKSDRIPSHVRPMNHAQFVARFGNWGNPRSFQDLKQKRDMVLLGRYDENVAEAYARNWLQCLEI